MPCVRRYIVVAQATILAHDDRDIALAPAGGMGDTVTDGQHGLDVVISISYGIAGCQSLWIESRSM
jgi:hypothetical protein